MDSERDPLPIRPDVPLAVPPARCASSALPVLFTTGYGALELQAPLEMLEALEVLEALFVRRSSLIQHDLVSCLRGYRFRAE